jgi:hypothetical protein
MPSSAAGGARGAVHAWAAGDTSGAAAENAVTTAARALVATADEGAGRAET